MAGLEVGEVTELTFEFGLLAEVLIAGGCFLDGGAAAQFGVVCGGLVVYVQRGAHDLSDEPGFALDPLPLLDAPGSFDDVGMYGHVVVLVALPDDPAFALFDV